MPARSGIEVVITALTRNQVYRQRYRGFESHPLRQKKAHPSGWAFFVNIAAGPGRKNKIVTQQSGHDAEAKKRPVRLRDLAARRGLVPKGAFLSCAM